MPIAREFLAWDRPALAGAVDYLLNRYRVGSIWDLRQVVVALPGARAGRRLLELLVDRADESGCRLVPPIITTAGKVPELLYHPQRPFASEVVQQLAWLQAIRGLPIERLEPVVPYPPPPTDFEKWAALASLLSRQHRELAGDRLDFQKLAELDWDVGAVWERRRWQVLSEIQSAYLRLLDSIGCWDLQTARLVAIERGECRTDCDIVLIGTSDLNRTIRQMLDDVADRVTTLIHAPREWADRFDAHGCVEPAAWSTAEIDLRSSQVEVVDGPADQAAVVVEYLAGLGPRHGRDEVTIGILDDTLVPQLQRQLGAAGLPTRWVVGRTMAMMAPFQLLAVAADFLSDDRFAAFASLVRHPDVGDFLGRSGVPGDWLTRVDMYYAERLPQRLGSWGRGNHGEDVVQQVYDRMKQWLAPLQGPARSLRDWSQPLQTVLETIYSGVDASRSTEAGHYLLAACGAVRTMLLQFSTMPPVLAAVLSAPEAIAYLLRNLESQEIPPLPAPDSVEMLGWLELPLDDAPVTIITSLNEGAVPESLNSDLFLPNQLRVRLGLLDNARRYARDAYALSAILSPGRVAKVVTGRRDADGNPRIPGRLLFATRPEEAVERARRWFAPPVARPPLAAPTVRNRSTFVVPRPAQDSATVSRLSVTAFRNYLACPFRFYLRNILRLRALDDSAEELDGAMFGTMVHEVLRIFGTSEHRNATDVERIRAVLHDSLDDVCRRYLADQQLAPIQLQITQMRLRLDAFAQWQAEWARSGWTIQHVEMWGEGNPLKIEVGGESVIVDGRIDRVDWHEHDRRWMLLDYKTSDTAMTPEKVHRQGDDWVDLQLPLYHQLTRALSWTEPVDLGYLVLPKDLQSVGLLKAKWNSEELKAAQEVARNVVQRILNREFWPPTSPAPLLLPEFDRICQERTLDRNLGEEPSPACAAVDARPPAKDGEGRAG
ncbi:MAG: hypothetical protein FJ295_01100 [Planctomycetes bacterium]|nr:hypothetical protein [Planctomycetota bacterium]